MRGEIFKGEMEGGVRYTALVESRSFLSCWAGPYGRLPIFPGVDVTMHGYVSGLFWSLVVGHIPGSVHYGLVPVFLRCPSGCAAMPKVAI